MPTLRSLARTLKLSHSTVSMALRNSPAVRAKTKERVLRAAEAAGYRANPLTGALFSEIRRARAGDFHGVLGLILLEEPDRPERGNLFFEEQIRGARERATSLGFKLEIFTVGTHHVTLRRLDSILQARNIRGLILLPAWGKPNFSELDWSRYAGVYADYMIENPPLHCVCPDHYRSLTDVLGQLKTLGYKRPGLFVRKQPSDRLQNRWEGAMLAFQRNHLEGEPVPLLTPRDVTRENFMVWFKKHKPDVVLGHHLEAVEWMRESGAKIPAKHGFFALNIIASDREYAGLNQRPDLIGARAVDIVIAHLYHNEFGVPQNGVLTTIPGLFVNGPTIRQESSSAFDR